MFKLCGIVCMATAALYGIVGMAIVPNPRTAGNMKIQVSFMFPHVCKFSCFIVYNFQFPKLKLPPC